MATNTGVGNKQGNLEHLIARSLEEAVGVQVDTNLTSCWAFDCVYLNSRITELIFNQIIIILSNLNPVQSQSVWSIVESRDSEWRSSNLIVRALQYFTAIWNVEILNFPLSLSLSDWLGSLEGVNGSWQPVDTAVTVQTTGETTVSAATHLRQSDIRKGFSVSGR